MLLRFGIGEVICPLFDDPGPSRSTVSVGKNKALQWPPKFDYYTSHVGEATRENNAAAPSSAKTASTEEPLTSRMMGSFAIPQLEGDCPLRICEVSQPGQFSVPGAPYMTIAGALRNHNRNEQPKSNRRRSEGAPRQDDKDFWRSRIGKHV